MGQDTVALLGKQEALGHGDMPHLLGDIRAPCSGQAAQTPCAIPEGSVLAHK